MSVFDILKKQSIQTKSYYEDEDYDEENRDEDNYDYKKSKKNGYLYSLLVAILIIFIFSSFFLTQVDKALGESKFCNLLFKEDGEPTYLMNIIQLVIVFFIIKLISKW